MRKPIVQLLTSLMMMSTINCLQAQLIENGSFEISNTNPDVLFISLPTGDTSIVAWSILNGNIDLKHYIWQHSDGYYSIDLNGFGPGSISQTFNTKPDSTYCVQFYLAGNPAGDPIIKMLNVSVGNTSLDFNFDITGQSNQEMGWEERSFDFVAVSTLSSLTFTSLVLLDEHGPTIDNVQVYKCYDCAGTPYGSAIIDDCGECFEPMDPNFNQTCIEDIYAPTIFSPNDDGINDEFQLFKHSETEAKIITYRIFTRWGELIHQSNNFEFSDTSKWWTGEFKGKKVDDGVYLYYFEILFKNNITQNYNGTISIVK